MKVAHFQTALEIKPTFTPARDNFKSLALQGKRTGT
jgi:hypothetical protein